MRILAKERNKAALRNFEDDGLFVPYHIEILVQLQTQLANVNAHRAVFGRAVVSRFTEHSATNTNFAQIFEVSRYGPVPPNSGANPESGPTCKTARWQ